MNKNKGTKEAVRKKMTERIPQYFYTVGFLRSTIISNNGAFFSIQFINTILIKERSKEEEDSKFF